ncbi:MAG: aspartate/glutamate racemase family protein [Christensenellales bacterium]|jgi:Asp/Glu/hydantoin racemase
MEKKVVVIHTSFVSVDDLKRLFEEFVPEAAVRHIVDDSLLPEVLLNGGLTKSVIRRFCAYALEAEAMGADIIFNQCSSVGEAVDVARRIIGVPILKVDEPMAEEAVRIGGQISVVATVASTLGPSIRLIERTAEKAGKNVEIKPCLVKGAFDILYYQGDKETHNRMVLDMIRSEAPECDAIVLAQGSMICLLPQIADIQTPVLTSPKSGVRRVKEALESIGKKG